MPNDVIKAFGDAVKDARHKRGLTQQGLADQTGISKRHIAKIENGISNPSFEIVSILAVHLSLSVDKVLFQTDFSENSEVIQQINVLLTKCKESQKNTVLKMTEIMVDEFENNSNKKGE
ncbi:helix-turn-helix domain-containing protein [[Clostridium] innocuum]|nr:helix-turn-helix domain-containing protein [[Clostridium] innocuum]